VAILTRSRTGKISEAIGYLKRKVGPIFTIDQINEIIEKSSLSEL